MSEKKQIIINEIVGLKEYINGKRFLLVRGSSYDKLNVKEFFEEFSHDEFSSFTPNPLYEQVEEGVRIFNSGKYDMIVAVGGGSAMDVAKCIKLFCCMNSDKNYLEQEKTDTGIPLVAIPTTAGTGSESTKHAVIYYDGVKQSISHESIIPDVAVLEPLLLKDLPIYQKKCTMLDALAQAIESWWSVNSTEESRRMSRSSVELIADNWREYIEDNTLTAACKIMEAANLAGQAINITATTAPHAMSYKLTSMYGLPHGHAVAVCLVKVWKYMLDHMENCVDKRGIQFLSEIFSEITIDVNWFEDLLRSLDIKSTSSDDKENDIDILTKSVNQQRLKNNPVYLDETVIRALYEEIVI